MNINPFRDSARADREALFRKEMLYGPYEVGNPDSEETVVYAGSELSHREYNEVFEGDCWSIPHPNGHQTVNLRDLHFQYNGNGSGTMTSEAREGFLGTSLNAERSHAHFVTGGGEATIEHRGNSQRNISVVEAGPGKKMITQHLGGGDDKSVLYLNGTSGTIFVNGGGGEDRLEIHLRDPQQTYTLIEDPEFLPDPNDGFQGLRIVTSSVEEIEEFKDF